MARVPRGDLGIGDFGGLGQHLGGNLGNFKISLIISIEVPIHTVDDINPALLILEEYTIVPRV